MKKRTTPRVPLSAEHYLPRPGVDYLMPKITLFPSESWLGNETLIVTVEGKAGLVICAGEPEEAIDLAIRHYRKTSRALRPVRRLLARLGATP